MTELRSSPPKLTLVVARARGGVIGRNGAIPWRLSTDMQQFRRATMGKPVLMGRKTWESFPKAPLPGRANLVLTRSQTFRADGAWTFSDLAAMLATGRAMAEQARVEEVCVIGGGELYNATLPIADRIRLTEVDITVDGDTRLAFDETDWREVSRTSFEPGPKDDAPFTVRVLERT